MAFNMAVSSENVTKPNPLDLPVSRSVITLHCVTSPNDRKASSRLLSVVAHARPPTKHLYSLSPIFIFSQHTIHGTSATDFPPHPTEVTNKPTTSKNKTIYQFPSCCGLLRDAASRNPEREERAREPAERERLLSQQAGTKTEGRRPTDSFFNHRFLASLFAE
jgi:hypothetical protein